MTVDGSTVKTQRENENSLGGAIRPLWRRLAGQSQAAWGLFPEVKLDGEES